MGISKLSLFGIIFSFLVIGFIVPFLQQAEAAEVCGVEICTKKMSHADKIAQYMTSIGEPTNSAESSDSTETALIESIKLEINQLQKRIDILSVQLFQFTGETDTRSDVAQQAINPNMMKKSETQKFDHGVSQSTSGAKHFADKIGKGEYSAQDQNTK